MVTENDPMQRVIRFPLDPGLALLGDPLSYSEDQRRYAESIVKTRLHQPVFRARVLNAYKGACTVCDLRHSELLDAAHIAPDASERGVPHVTNGLAMCKIHHAAYDRALMGIRPDFEVRVNARLLDEVDGPMLRHGLQEMHGRPIRLPKSRMLQPSRDLLASRYEAFQKR
ncbi:HNH endonuclease [Microbacterium sp. zg.Y909]|nr:HNH endonuclease [Microbacterium sp. zg.Y909]